MYMFVFLFFFSFFCQQKNDWGLTLLLCWICSLCTYWEVQRIMHLILLSLYKRWGIMLFPCVFLWHGLVFKENYYDLSNILSILASLDDYQMYGILFFSFFFFYGNDVFCCCRFKRENVSFCFSLTFLSRVTLLCLLRFLQVLILGALILYKYIYKYICVHLDLQHDIYFYGLLIVTS